jgi:O-antigen ligase
MSRRNRRLFFDHFVQAKVDKNNEDGLASSFTMKISDLSNHLDMRSLLLGSLIVLILILPFDEGGNGYIVPLITQVGLLLWATGWAIRTIRRGQFVAIFDRIDLFVVGFLIWAGISSYFSVYKYATFLELIKIISYAALFYLCRMMFPLQAKRIVLLLAILASSVLQFLVALYAFFIRHTPILQAGFVNPNELACFFVIGISIALSFLLFQQNIAPEFTENTEPYQKRKNNLSVLSVDSVAAGCLIIALIIAVLALKSRGAVISFVITGVLLTTLKKRRWGLIFLMIICLLVLLPTPWGNMIQHLRKADDPYAYQRIGIWQSSLRMIADYPIVGVGLGMYKSYGTAYNFPVEHRIARYEKQVNVAHNDALQIGAEMGICGLILFLGGIGWLGSYSLIQLRKTPVSWEIIAASAGICSVLINGLFSNTLSSPAIAMMVVLLGTMVIDGAEQYNCKTVTFQRSWWWYGVVGLFVVYLLVPVIGYPFLGHVSYLNYQKHRKARNVVQAVSALQTAIKFAPIHAYYHYTLGQLYLTAFRNQPNLDAFYGGYQELTQAIRYNSRDFEFYVSLAELHREMFRQKFPTKPTAQNAVQVYRDAIRCHPFDPFIRLSLATLYADLEEFDQAIAAVQEAVQLEPNFVGGYQMLGKLLTHLGREQEAKEAFARAEQILKQYQGHEHDSGYVKTLLRPLD